MKFHWTTAKDSQQVETLKFTRAILGFRDSPFQLNATVNVHSDASNENYPELVENIEEIQENLYVNDIVTGGSAKGNL